MSAQKPALGWKTDREAVRLLDKVSKAALIDLVLDLVALDGAEPCDAPVTAARLKDHLEPVLIRRGDKIPKLKQPKFVPTRCACVSGDPRLCAFCSGGA